MNVVTRTDELNLKGIPGTSFFVNCTNNPHKDEVIQFFVLSSLEDLVSTNITFIKSQLDFSEFKTYLASEDSLKKEWLLPEEDEAWKDL